MNNPFNPGTEEYQVWERMESESPYMPEPAEELTPLQRLRKMLLTTKTLGNQPKAIPLVPGAFYRDKLAWIYGAPKSFKSFLALDLAGCVAAGLPWQGFPAGESGNVLYLVAEGSSGIEDRVRAWEEHNNLEMLGVEFLPTAVQAANATEWSALVELATEIDPALVVIDTQARVTAGMEENSATEMGQFIRRLDQLRVATGALILPIHHTGRNGEHLRGSIAIDGAADTVLKVVRTEDQCVVTCTYQKDAEEFEPFLTRVVRVGESLTLRRDRTTRVSATLPTWVTEWWNQHGTDPVAPSMLFRTDVVSETVFHREKKILISQGILIKDESGRYPTYRLSGPPPGLEDQAPEGASQASSHSPTKGGGVWESVYAEAPRESEGASREDGPTLCVTCGEPLDAIHIRDGWDHHPGC